MGTVLTPATTSPLGWILIQMWFRSIGQGGYLFFKTLVRGIMGLCQRNFKLVQLQSTSPCHLPSVGVGRQLLRRSENGRNEYVRYR